MKGALEMQKLFGPLVAGALIAGSLAVSAGTARADTGPVGTLICDNGQTYEATGFGRGSALHLVNSTGNFVLSYIEVVSTGTVLRDNQGHQNSTQITCTSTSPVSGNTAIVTGTITPANS